MKKNKSAIKSIIIAVVFFAITAAFGLIAPKIWNSPDETAVAFFSKTFAANGRLWVEDGLNVFNNDMIHPRSILSIMAMLVPASFYGQMIVIGGVMKIIGASALSLTTPFFTSLAGICIFFFLRKRGEATGLVGQTVFYLTPAVWYFASRGLFPNLLFCDLAIVGAAMFYFHPFFKLFRGRGRETLERGVDALLGGLFIGAAMIVRPVEFIWFAPVIIVALWITRKNYRWFELIPGVLSFVVFVFMVLVLNNGLYGSPFSFGYTAGAVDPGVAVPAIALSSRLPSWLAAPRPFILPFGFHPKLAVINLYDYLVLLTPWFALLAIWGLFIAFFRTGRRYAKYLLIVFAWLLLILGIYYGSGILNDPTVSGLSIGSSYVRYFLPLYIVLVPAVAEGIVFFLNYFKNKKIFGTLIAYFAIASLTVLSAWTVYFRSSESLVPVFQTLVHYADVKKQVLAIVKPGDIIITERSDKIFFPDRRVLLNLRDPETMKALPKLVHGINIYYYGIAISDNESAKMEAELGKYKLQLGRIKAFGGEMLYQITKE
jgi:hypothetical protein